MHSFILWAREKMGTQKFGHAENGHAGTQGTWTRGHAGTQALWARDLAYSLGFL